MSSGRPVCVAIVGHVGDSRAYRVRGGTIEQLSAVIAAGALAIPTGGLSTLARLEMMRMHAPTVLIATPSYALHLGASEDACHDAVRIAAVASAAACGLAD